MEVVTAKGHRAIGFTSLTAPGGLLCSREYARYRVVAHKVLTFGLFA